MKIATLVKLQSLQHMSESDRRTVVRRLEKMIRVYAARGIDATFSDDGETVFYRDTQSGGSIASRPITDFIGN